MHCITIVELYYQDLRIPECGMLWVAATIGWAKPTKLKDATPEQKTVKIEKELQFIRWEDFIISWAQHTSKRLSMHLNSTFAENKNKTSTTKNSANVCST